MHTEDSPVRVGFAVIYRWWCKPGCEEQLVASWDRLTLALKRDRGALGSRLHREANNTWVAYAQWPTRDTWQSSSDQESPDPEASRIMRECIDGSDPPILLEPYLDRLERIPAGPPD